MRSDPVRAAEAAIRARLDRWRARIGDPTCHAGCATCCQQPVAMSSHEALILLDALAVHPRGDALLDACRSQSVGLHRLLDEDRTHASGSVLDRIPSLGPCPLLDLDDEMHLASGVRILSGRCSVHAHRPIACRTLHAWHEPRFCRHPRYRIGTPAELFEIRDRGLLAALRAEAESGRVPFWGHLPLVLDLLHRRRAAYEAGTHLGREIESPTPGDPGSGPEVEGDLARFVGAGLLVFPVAGDREGILAEIADDLHTHEARYAEDQIRPEGQSRGDLADSRDALAPIPEDPETRRD